MAKKISRNNNDGGWLRHCSISSTTFGVRVDEDRDQDNERGIAAGDAEQAGIVAFSQACHANLAADLSVTKTRFSTTAPGGGDFHIPGATVEYLITVTNNGNAPPNYGSVINIDSLPADLALVVGDFGAPGSGPIEFTDGSPATGLSCTYVSAASATDCFDFSTDGSDFSYAFTDIGNGTDPNISHIRIRPNGFMEGDTGAGSTSYEVRLRAVIK